MKILTAGYEGVSLKAFLDGLRKAEVEIVVDVRKTARSLKRGFSKRALKKAIEDLGIDYFHFPEFGSTTEERRMLEITGNWEKFASSVRKRLQELSGRIQELYEKWKGKKVCFLCFERNHRKCHRTLVAEEFAKISGDEIMHLQIIADQYTSNWHELAQSKRKQVGKCEYCGGFAYDVHHKDGDKGNCADDNLVVLCRSCHRKLHSNRRKEAKWFEKRGMRQRSLFENRCLGSKCRPKDLLVSHTTSRKEAFLFLLKHHYLHRTPAGHKILFRISCPVETVGFLVFGNPLARLEDQKTTLELTRMCLLDCCPRNSESYVLGKAIKYIRKHLPHIKRIISYADPEVGHSGSIYKAVGFKHIGMSSGGNWNNREGRTAGKQSRKMKFELILAKG